MIDTSLFRVFWNSTQITNNVTGSFSWSTDEDTIGQQFTFSYAQTDFSKPFPLKVGEFISLWHGGEKYYNGVIVDISFDSTEPRQITCIDFAFYLAKSETTIQFKNTPASEAIKKLLPKDYSHIVLQIENIPFKITKIYKGRSYTDIIKDILNEVKIQTGISYVFELHNQLLIIRKKTDLIINIDTSHIMNPRRKLSIQEMKTRVEVITSGENSFQVLATSDNWDSILKYGLLKKVHEVSDEEKSKAKNIANKLLSELNRVDEETEIELIGDLKARAGRILKIFEPYTGISGVYLIKNAHHTVSRGAYTMNLKLEKVM